LAWINWLQALSLSAFLFIVYYLTSDRPPETQRAPLNIQGGAGRYVCPRVVGTIPPAAFCMQLPFTPGEFFRVFADYNEAVWPVQPVLLSLALLTAVLVFRRASWSNYLISTFLGIFWLWMGLVYQLAFFARINPLAYGFSALSILGAAAFFWHGLYRRHLQFKWQGSGRNLAGAALIIFALVIYPLWNRWTGHTRPAIPTFGLPCPTTLFTIGILALLDLPYPRSVLLAPIVWCAIGVQAAFLLDVTPDLSLLAGAAAAVSLWVAAGRSSRTVASR
jgi:hypothetical protein